MSLQNHTERRNANRRDVSSGNRRGQFDRREWAHGDGLKFHYGRCGTLNKVAHAIRIGADSIDSAFPMWTRQRWRLFVETVTNGPIQGELL